MSVARQFAEMLELLDRSGPSLSIPVLTKAFPQGLDEHAPAVLERLKLAYAEWQENLDARTPDPGIHLNWIRFVLREVLEHPDEVIQEGQAIPPSHTVTVAEQHERLRPDMVLANPAGRPGAGKPRVLVTILDPGTDLEKPLSGKRWKESPAGRMAVLLRGLDVRLGLITNGEHWMLVDAARGETTGYTSWYAWLWIDEHLTLRAFRTLLGPTRLFGVTDAETLEALLSESAEHQQEVTDQLGRQVRRAVEILVQAIDRSDREFKGALLAGVPDETVYEAAVTFMMRLVFLFCAEERALLPLEDEQYAANYAASTLRDQLRETAEQHGEEVLERRTDAWQRLLAAFRAVHGGVEHEDLRLPPYGGHLFDPDRYPFLEGRTPGSSWLTTPARPLPVNNRTTLHLLEALQQLRDRKTGEAQRLSFRSLDIEQIGHVYEGLLDHTARRAGEPVVSLKGKEGDEPEIEIPVLERELARGPEPFSKWAKQETGRTPASIRKDLEYRPDAETEQRLLISCENDGDLLNRVKPFAALVRDDSFGRPVVIPKGALYVTAGADRRTTGTHYTPRSLTEPIVQHALEPHVYEGPAEGAPPDAWKLKPAKRLLSLKICDLACGSGAFLVQACRYLSDRLVEAWEDAERANPGKVVVTPDGELSEARPSECLIPREPEERRILARRLIADRCLYGVDKNPLAVEMAKLSLWLITLQKDRPFTFVDHAIKLGDSLLGISDPAQIEYFHPDPKASAGQLGFASELVRGILARTGEVRRDLERFTVLDVRDAERKADLLARADGASGVLRLLGDLVIAAAVETAGKNAKAAGKRLAALGEEVRGRLNGIGNLENTVKVEAALRPLLDEVGGESDSLKPDTRFFHWAIEFPEVFERDGDGTPHGFDVFVGNPPFMGGQKITGALGTDYRNHLVRYLGGEQRGSADLCAYFLLRATGLLNENGTFGYLATNTIAQGDTREVGLDRMAKEGVTLYRAVASRKWPGQANLEVAHLWGRRGAWDGAAVLEEKPVSAITPFLSIPGRVQGKPYRLKENAGKSFQGSIVLGMGFVLQPEEAEALIRKDPRNRDVLFPYLNGEDLNSRPDQSPSRWVINFFDWPEERAREYPDCVRIVEEKVKPERAKLIGRNPIGTRRGTHWWQYASDAKSLYRAIAGMERVLVCSEVTKFLTFCAVPNGIVYSANLDVFAIDIDQSFPVLQSSIHDAWARKYSSQLETRLKYSPGNAFETFPMPSSHDCTLGDLGRELHSSRKAVALSLNIGLTGVSNLVHDPSQLDRRITNLRNLITQIDQSVLVAFGWSDLDSLHGFYESDRGIRFTIAPPVRDEILARLLELNHQRHEEELKGGAATAAKPVKRTGARKSSRNLSLDFTPETTDE